MALCVWLPLNGNLNNQGIGTLSAPFSIVSPVYENGKIGQNLKLTKQKSNIVTVAELVNQNKLTCSFWFKLTPDSTFTAYQDLCSFGVQRISTGSTGWMRAEVNNTAGSSVSWYANGLMASAGISSPTQTSLGQWYHMTFAVDGLKTYLYINGILTNTYTITSDYVNDYKFLGTMAIGDSGNMYCTLADFRVYDECLSPKQIKEIAKGLVCHYKLDGPKANKNYIKNSNWSNKSNAGIYTFDGDVVTFHSDTLAASGISFTQTMDSAGITDFRNKQITFSMEYQITEALTFGTTNPWVGFEMSVSRNTTTGGNNQWLDWYGGKSIPTGITNGWIKKSFTVTVTDYDIASLSINFYMRDTTGTIKYRHPKVEIGNKATPWIPNEADTLYTALGYGNNICTDVSGNGYNLIQNGAVAFNTDTIRYSGSSLFDGNTSCFTIPFNTMCPENIFTINVWFKKDSVGTKNYETLIGGPSGFEMDTRNNNANVLSLYMASTRGGNRATDISFGEWHMVTMTRDGIKEKYYIDGVFKSEIDAVSMPTGTYYIGAWSTATKQNYYGLMSDFRIYATVLFADDIKELYQTSALIDNKNNIYAYEFVEEE